MATATKTKPKTRAPGPASPATRIPELETHGASSSARQGLLRGEGRDLPVRLIGRSPYQPRQIFDEQELRNLAATIAAAGVLQPIIVRPKGQRYELVAGERRLRAAKIARLEKIPAIVRKLSDAQARELAAIENLQRKDLNPIEEARAFGELLKGGREKGKAGKGEEKITQEELARRLGVSQPHVANRLRLLGLPAGWQQRIISGEITATNARCLLPYKDHPGLMQAIEKELHRELKHHPQPSSEEFEQTVKSAVYEQTRPISGRGPWNSRLGDYPEPFQPTAQEREKLKLIEVPDFDGKLVQRVSNVKLWDKLQKAHVNKLIRERDKQQATERGRRKAEKRKPVKKLTPAEKKQWEKRQRQRARERARLYARRLWEWKINWLRYLIYSTVGDPAGFATETLLRLLVYFSAAPQMGNIYRRGQLLQTYLRSRSIRVPVRYGLADLWAGLSQLQNADFVDDAARFFVAGMFYHAKQGPAAIVPEEDVAAIAEFLCIDVQQVWRKGQAGPLSESYWNLHSKDQLVELAKELKFKLDASAPKTQMVKTFLQYKKPLPLPKEIGKAKRPR